MYAGLQVVPFMFVATHPLLRNILIREQVDIVHGHQAPSMLTHETMLHASTMGYKVTTLLSSSLANDASYIHRGWKTLSLLRSVVYYAHRLLHSHLLPIVARVH